ncbi:riboflavin transporter 2-like isoform X2 [Sitodiplosis mosellana]|nr:riboflavin transporter 2-like isoform X2 [Sitodiplosis mosellana]XP_055325667.1 riboflavin transporter 2-like isoform X2 [Sitodiplosis mosellana]XP_055325669.1 riboflavin transporter 2-like isoform X2 [Sitodiplosis mosellana]XP_055325670.1 riboflavin transporter 2-like isoform X2 [Sitodiplosis mosellana]XP_055325671.1 riboflavin transporter 2-like isoform X2 [Sitodiplosis mosellana]XP_055325672.1 riboflavin transporter 2-like isoform X2 [Sitodiplosis mosellana]
MSDTQKYVPPSDMNMGPKSNAHQKRNLFVDALALLFGMSSWLGVTSSYLQLPLIISTMPEGWSMPAYMTVVVQSSNIISFAYVFYQKYAPKKLNDAYLIYFTMSMGCLTAIGMAFFYQNTITINGKEHSIAYLIFVFLFATVGTVSSVLFLPFMGRFRECYLVSYMCGQGMNGLFTSILTLIQGIGVPECIPDTDGKLIKYIPPARFGTQTFFLLVFGLLLISTIAFILLNKMEVCKKELAAGIVMEGNEYYYENEDRHDVATGEVPENVLNLSTFNYVKLLSAMVLIGFFGNGIFPGLQSYSSLPYGFLIYHLVASLASIGNAIGSFIAQFVPHTSIRILDFLIVIVIVLGVYIFYAAVKNPFPPFLHTEFGPVFMIIQWMFFIGIQSYMKTSIATIFRYQEGKSLVLMASTSLVCSVVGSIFNLFIVTYTQLFVSYEPC